VTAPAHRTWRQHGGVQSHERRLALRHAAARERAGRGDLRALLQLGVRSADRADDAAGVMCGRR